MKLLDSYMAWTPTYCADDPRAGALIVGSKAEVLAAFDTPPRHTMWLGVCANAPADPTARELIMFIHFNTLVVRDGIDPKAVHEEFLMIDEYRQRISSDTPGAEG